jgi:hypothetical protein
MNHFMDFDPRLVRERNEERLAEARSVRLERALRENGDPRERKEERARMKGTLGGFLGRIAIPSPVTVVVALLALFVAASGTAVAAISFTASDGTITACRDNKTGVLRVIQSGQNCTASKETTITWKDGITGKVADADKLDGQDASAFLGANQKATDAAHADAADHATTADSATHAASAGDANTLDGKHSTDFVSGTGSMTPVYEIFRDPDGSGPNEGSSNVISVPGAQIQAACVGQTGGTQVSLSTTNDTDNMRLWRDDGGADPTVAFLSGPGGSVSSPPSTADRVIWQGSSPAGTFTAVLFTKYETTNVGDYGSCYLSGYVISANTPGGTSGGGIITPGGNA